jgi:glycosyltransferase involved in cell wall biosynthesis
METSQHLVSVIVTCYNQARYLPDSLGSVLAQSYPHWECIIVNDGSPDKTEDVAQKWLAIDNRFKYVEKENGGLSSARNAGLRVAVGEYIQFLDADDILEKNKIGQQIAYLNNSDGRIDIVVSGYRYFLDGDRSRELLIFGPNDILPEVIIDRNDKKDLVKLFARRNPMVVSAPLYNRSVFQRIGNFDEELSANEDWDLHFRCAANGIIFQHNGYSPNSKTLIRIHTGSMITNRRNMIWNLWKFQQKHREYREFALENGLLVTDVWHLLKMLVPPIFIRLVRWIMTFKIK